MHDALLHVTSQFALHHQPITADWIALIFYFSGRLNQQDMWFFYFFFIVVKELTKQKQNKNGCVGFTEVVGSLRYCLNFLHNFLFVPSCPWDSIRLSSTSRFHHRIRPTNKRRKKKRKKKNITQNEKQPLQSIEIPTGKWVRRQHRKQKYESGWKDICVFFLRFRIIDTSGQQVIIYFIWFSFTFPVFGVF